jgi:heme/copper-type cytochrome/quinol oxidase subunit 1
MAGVRAFLLGVLVSGCVCAWMGVAPASGAAQTSWYAYPSGGASSPTGCPQTGDSSSQCTLTQALALAQAGDTVALAVSGNESDITTGGK